MFVFQEYLKTNKCDDLPEVDEIDEIDEIDIKHTPFFVFYLCGVIWMYIIINCILVYYIYSVASIIIML